jgi:hypothetical protein
LVAAGTGLRCITSKSSVATPYVVVFYLLNFTFISGILFCYKSLLRYLRTLCTNVSDRIYRASTGSSYIFLYIPVFWPLCYNFLYFPIYNILAKIHNIIINSYIFWKKFLCVTSKESGVLKE